MRQVTVRAWGNWRKTGKMSTGACGAKNIPERRRLPACPHRSGAGLRKVLYSELTDRMATLLEEIKAALPNLWNPDKPIGALMYGLIFFLGAWIVGRLLSLAVERVLKHPRHLHLAPDPTAIRFLGQLARLAVYTFAFLNYAHIV